MVSVMSRIRSRRFTQRRSSCLVTALVDEPEQNCARRRVCALAYSMARRSSSITDSGGASPVKATTGRPPLNPAWGKLAGAWCLSQTRKATSTRSKISSYGKDGWNVLTPHVRRRHARGQPGGQRLGVPAAARMLLSPAFRQCLIASRGPSGSGAAGRQRDRDPRSSVLRQRLRRGPRSHRRRENPLPPDHHQDHLPGRRPRWVADLRDASTEQVKVLLCPGSAHQRSGKQS